MFDLSVYYLFLQYFDTVGWVFWPVKTVSHITYTVFGGDVKHCSIQSSLILMQILVLKYSVNFSYDNTLPKDIESDLCDYCNGSVEQKNAR